MKLEDRFFEGVVLAADVVLPAATRPRSVSDIPGSDKAPEVVGPKRKHRMRHRNKITFRWLEDASGDADRIQGVPGVYRKGRVPDSNSLSETLTDLNMNIPIHIKRPEIANIVSGAQTTLAYCVPDSVDMFRSDMEILGDAVPKLVRLYKKNRIPDEAIPKLVALEYSYWRSKDPSRSLKFALVGLSNMFGRKPAKPTKLPPVGLKYAGLGGRYGLLSVDTTPAPSDVFLDSLPLGNSPIKNLGVVAGPHDVRSQNRALRAFQAVTVLPATLTPVSLALS